MNCIQDNHINAFSPDTPILSSSDLKNREYNVSKIEPTLKDNKCEDININTSTTFDKKL